MTQSPKAVNIVRIDHVVIRVDDLEAMIDFYATVLGCRLEKGPGDMGLAQLRAGASLIDLVDAGGPLGRDSGDPPSHTAPNMDHLCLQVDPWDAAAIYTHLHSHGVEADEVASRYGADGYGPSIYFDDPEGNRIELKGPGTRAGKKDLADQ